MTREKLVVITPVFPSLGEEHRGNYIRSKVQAMQHRVDVSVLCISGTPPAIRLQRHNYYSSSRTRQPIPGIPTTFLQYSSTPLVSRWMNGPRCYNRLKPIVESMRPDALLAYWIYPQGYAALGIARDLGIPVIIGALGSDVRRIADPVTRLRVSRTLREAPGVTTVSEELRQCAGRLGARLDRVHTIHNGCDHEIFDLHDRRQARLALAVDPDAELILFVGWLLRLKGVRDLLEAMAALAARRPKAVLAFVGEGDQMPYLQQQATALGLDHRVIFPGRCSATQVAQWLAASNLLCLPSYSEGCPNVVIEALCCGRPVVACNVGGIPELVDAENGCLVPVGSPSVLAETLNSALVRTWDESKIAGRYRRSWKDVADETLDLLSTQPPLQPVVSSFSLNS